MKVAFTTIEMEGYTFNDWWKEVRRLARHAHFLWALGGKRDSRQFWDEGFTPAQYLSDLNTD